MTARARLAAVAGVAAGLACVLGFLHGGYPTPTGPVVAGIAFHLVVGWTFLAAGLVAWVQRPDSRVGPLLTLACLAWFLMTVAMIRQPWAHAIGQITPVLHLGVVAQVMLTYPSGRIEYRWQRVLVALAWLCTVPLTVALVLVFGGEVRPCEACDQNPMLLHSTEPQPDPAPAFLVALVVTAVVGAAIAFNLRRYRRSGEALRRSLLPGMLAGLGYGGVLVLHRWSNLLEMPGGLRAALSWFTIGSVVLFPIGTVAGLVRTRLDRVAVADLAVELAGSPAPARLRDVLGRALHDRTADLLYVRSGPEGAQYVDTAGRPADPDAPAYLAGRTVTPVLRDGRRIAVLVHDPAVTAEHPALVEAVLASVALAVDNARLQAELRAQLAEVRDSRARIVTRVDAERRRVERNLHDGAQQRLLNVMLALRLAEQQLPAANGTDPSAAARQTVREAAGELTGALDELRELARGIHPAVLTEAGPATALRSAADRCPVPVELEVALGPERLPAPIEETLYYVGSEALANVAKHGAATEVRMSLRLDGDRVRFCVQDDGRGGADPDGSGLRGLADRVAALDGVMRIVSPPGAGTRLEVELPCG